MSSKTVCGCGPVKCSDCGGGCYRPECLPEFSEDRLRFWRNHKGTRYSYTLGHDMPESRAQRRLIEKSGVVFCSPGDNTSPEHSAAMEYHRAVEQGASHEEAERHAPWPAPKPRSLKPYVDRWARSKKDWSDVEVKE